MSDKPTVNLKQLVYSHDKNPFLEAAEPVRIKRKRVRSNLAQKQILDADTGELVATSVIHEIQDKDSDEFVKVFSAGIAAAYELSKTAQRVFQAILQEYERAPMSSGFVDSVYLAWFDDGLCGRAINMSEKTFQRGLKELLARGFLAPRSPNLYWVNPSLFFKGDRVMFVKEYRRKKQLSKPEKQDEQDDQLQLDGLNPPEG
jgi:hypothetical protein